MERAYVSLATVFRCLIHEIALPTGLTNSVIGTLEKFHFYPPWPLASGRIALSLAQGPWSITKIHGHDEYVYEASAIFRRRDDTWKFSSSSGFTRSKNYEAA